MWKIYWRRKRCLLPNLKLKWKDSACDLSTHPGEEMLQNIPEYEGHSPGRNCKLDAFREWAGKNRHLVSKANHPAWWNRFPTQAVLLPAWTGLQLLLSAGADTGIPLLLWFIAVSTGLAATQQVSWRCDVLRHWRWVHCHWGPLNRGKYQSHFQMFILFDSCKNAFQWSNLAIWFSR